MKICLDPERCKGCGLCRSHCPKGLIQSSGTVNRHGYYPVTVAESGCTGCGVCALVCPDLAILAFRR